MASPAAQAPPGRCGAAGAAPSVHVDGEELLERLQRRHFERRLLVELRTTRGASSALSASSSARRTGTSVGPARGRGKRTRDAGSTGRCRALFENSRNSAVSTTDGVAAEIFLRRTAAVAKESGQRPVAAGQQRPAKHVQLAAASRKVAGFHVTSSIHACWIASRIFSPQCFGSRSKSSSAITQSRRSTKLTFNGSWSGYASLNLDRDIVDVGPFHLR